MVDALRDAFIAVLDALRRRQTMLSWALGFFILALIAAVFGFTGIAAGAAAVGKFLFVAFLIVAAISLIAGLVGPRRPI
jgi:uncharacterized membrane protein YtjA (UPF0391 family)